MTNVCRHERGISSNDSIRHYSCRLDLRKDSRTAARVAHRRVDHTMTCAGRIRCRASWVWMRRISRRDPRERGEIRSLSKVFSWSAALRWSGTGPGPSWKRRAYPGEHDGASHAIIVSRCGRGQARFWLFGKHFCRPTEPLHPTGFPDVRAGGTSCGKKAGSPSAIARWPDRPRGYVPATAFPKQPASMSANST